MYFLKLEDGVYKVFKERLHCVQYVLFPKAEKYPNSLYNDFDIGWN